MATRRITKIYKMAWTVNCLECKTNQTNLREKIRNRIPRSLILRRVNFYVKYRIKSSKTSASRIKMIRIQMIINNALSYQIKFLKKLICIIKNNKKMVIYISSKRYNIFLMKRSQMIHLSLRRIYLLNKNRSLACLEISKKIIISLLITGETCRFAWEQTILGLRQKQ